MRITALPEGSLVSTDYMAVDNPTNGTRKVNIYDYIEAKVPIHFSEAATALPKTISDARITADHRVVDLKFDGASSPFVVSWTTSAGSLVFSLTSGTFTACTLDFDLVLTQ